MTRLVTDVMIIGAGAVGTALARELSELNVGIVVVDRLSDVGGDASKSNSAIIHTGFDAPPGSLESLMVVSANPMYDALCADLDIPFQRCGAILVATTAEEEAELPTILKKAEQNQVFDTEYLTPREVLEMEPAVNPNVRGGLYIPREGIIDPFLLVVAQAENAARNGVAFITQCEVTGLAFTNPGFVAQTSGDEISARFVVNAGGLRADQISGYLGIDDFRVHARRGQFHVLDRAAPLDVRHIILPVPTKITKGKLLIPTVHGNWLMGPTAEELEDKTVHKTTKEGLEEIVTGVRKLVPGVDTRWTITQYDGLRPVRTPGGYHVRTFEHLPGYLEFSGIRSTGITSSVAVAKYARAKLVGMGLPTERRVSYWPGREGIPNFRDSDPATRSELIQKDPRYANVVCRCETVTEAEIVEAIHREPGARDLDGIKRRVRAGLGRCQGGFCGVRIPQIMAWELGVPLAEVSKKGHGSELLTGRRKSLSEEGAGRDD